MRSVFLVYFLLSTTFFSTTAVIAQPDSAAEKKDPVLIYREAGASPEQEAKIRQFAQEYEKSARVRVERIHNLSKQMTELSFEPELDEPKILALQNDINDAQNALSTERIKLMLKIRALLSAEQKNKLVELLKEKDSKIPAASNAPAVHQ